MAREPFACFPGPSGLLQPQGRVTWASELGDLPRAGTLAFHWVCASRTWPNIWQMMEDESPPVSGPITLCIPIERARAWTHFPFSFTYLTSRSARLGLYWVGQESFEPRPSETLRGHPGRNRCAQRVLLSFLQQPPGTWLVEGCLSWQEWGLKLGWEMHGFPLSTRGWGSLDVQPRLPTLHSWGKGTRGSEN